MLDKSLVILHITRFDFTVKPILKVIMENFMARTKLKSLAATTAITLAAVGTPAFAEEVTPTVDANTDTVVSTTEAPEAEAPKTSADAKPALDAQQAVVNDLGNEALTAMDADAAAQRNLSSAQAQVDAATQAVKDAEANAAAATPENIAANQADQAANLADQAANATETDEVNAEITAQTETVADAQTAVDTAQAEKDAADADVTAKEADVKSAQDAISGTGLAEAQANLDQAKADVKTAESNVTIATKAVDTANQADADRQTKIKAAETDIAVKTDAVNTSKAVLTKAQNDVVSTTDKLTKATDAVIKAQEALDKIDVLKLPDLTQFKDDYNNWKADRNDSDNKLFLTGSGVDASEDTYANSKIANDNTKVDVNNITNDQLIQASQLYADLVSQLRKQMGSNSIITVSQDAIDIAKIQAQKYIDRGTNVIDNGHVALEPNQSAENVGIASTITTMFDLKTAIFDNFIAMSFADAPSQWGHLQNNLIFGSKVGIVPVQVNGHNYIVVAFTNDGTPITNPNAPATLQAALTKAQADRASAKTASDAAKAQLTKASSDYATALEAKTAAEKVLADTTATPLQTQVAENNLRLANIALSNAQTRQADAQQAIDNFSADLATKKAALDDAKAKLADAQAVQASKATALDAAKALATELKGYLEAGTKLEEAKNKQVEAQAKLEQAKSKAANASKDLAELQAKLSEETAKLTILQAEYNVLVKAEADAKTPANGDTKVTLPNGSVITLPTDQTGTKNTKPAPIAQPLVTKPQAGITVTTTANGIKTTYSRVERTKALPQTGEQESILGLVGLAMMSTLGLAGARRKRRS